jgi:hypothetical protein
LRIIIEAMRVVVVSTVIIENVVVPLKAVTMLILALEGL